MRQRLAHVLGHADEALEMDTVVRRFWWSAGAVGSANRTAMTGAHGGQVIELSTWRARRRPLDPA